jgi:hypothetical protein
MFTVRSSSQTFEIQELFRCMAPKVVLMTSNAFISLKQIQRALNVDLLIVDEGHKAKNVDAQIRKAISDFKVNR